MSSPTEPVPFPLLPPKPPEIGSDKAFVLDPEEVPNIDDLVIQDDEPVDNVFVEKQQRLLTEPLYSSWPGPGHGRSFKVLANVGLFYAWKQPPVVPDVMLALDVPADVDLSKKENRSYFMWVMAKRPDVVIEIVSDRRGGEDTEKLNLYAQIGVVYYVIFDPEQHLSSEVLRIHRLDGTRFLPLPSGQMEEVGLGLVLWEGEFEGQHARWLRWCDAAGRPIPTGFERAEAERRAKEIAEQQLNSERDRVLAERREKEEAKARAQKLAEQLRALGIEPEGH